MGKIGKISSIKKEYSGDYKETLAGSLARNGYTRFPGTGVRFVPWKETNGEYRTGLNENALYIKQMERTNPEEAEQEKARVRALREDLEEQTGMDLGPRSEYYSKMFDSNYRQNNRAQVVKLKDGINMFNLDDPYQAITYHWLKVHEDIAPSIQAYKEGRVRNSQNISYFVDDFEYETEVEYSKNMKMNKAIEDLNTMTPDRQFKIARLLGLPIMENDKPSVIYNAINTFIKDVANNNTLQNVNMFNRINSMTDENFNVKFLVEEGLKYNVYRIKSMRIYEGETVIAKDKDELIENLSTPKYQDDLLALEEKVRQRKLQEKF